jgi:hypothetical protein
MASSSIFARGTGHPYRVENLADLPVDLRQLAEQSLTFRIICGVVMSKPHNKSSNDCCQVARIPLAA